VAEPVCVALAACSQALQEQHHSVWRRSARSSRPRRKPYSTTGSQIQCNACSTSTSSAVCIARAPSSRLFTPHPPVIQYRTLTCGGNPVSSRSHPEQVSCSLQVDRPRQWLARCSQAPLAASRRCSLAAKRSPSRCSAGMHSGRPAIANA